MLGVLTAKNIIKLLAAAKPCPSWRAMWKFRICSRRHAFGSVQNKQGSESRSPCWALGLLLVVELRPDHDRVSVWSRDPLRMLPMKVLVAEREVKVIGDFVGNAADRARKIQRIIR
jgi:hypothetical protein